MHNVRTILEDIIDAWGPSKTAQVILLTFIGASVFRLMGTAFIPNDPKNIELYEGESK